MMCQNCGKNNATTHIRTEINRVKKEQHLCAECANSNGFPSLFLSSIFDNRSLFDDFFNFGRSMGRGMEDEFQTMRVSPELLLEEKETYKGVKLPDEVVPKKETEIEAKKRELKEAVAVENYEQAAILRDEIKSFEENAK